ncbi:Hypothetical protein, putative [Bodo saltans]|uniref:Uncharacterized protein n=1 Tax=Bodo saltans TaxID=75058 RepID=A0A0S4IRZ0_BODSA|nr:Hypothetical protein, putative [Bodo saltans]|eukprot:CUF47826.1 Hypothetical protein, putative [Bodo saltans]
MGNACSIDVDDTANNQKLEESRGGRQLSLLPPSSPATSPQRSSGGGRQQSASQALTPGDCPHSTPQQQLSPAAVITTGQSHSPPAVTTEALSDTEVDIVPRSGWGGRRQSVESPRINNAIQTPLSPPVLPPPSSTLHHNQARHRRHTNATTHHARVPLTVDTSRRISPPPSSHHRHLSSGSCGGSSGHNDGREEMHHFGDDVESTVCMTPPTSHSPRNSHDDLHGILPTVALSRGTATSGLAEVPMQTSQSSGPPINEAQHLMIRGGGGRGGSKASSPHALGARKLSPKSATTPHGTGGVNKNARLRTALAAPKDASAFTSILPTTATFDKSLLLSPITSRNVETDSALSFHGTNAPVWQPLGDRNLWALDGDDSEVEEGAGSKGMISCSAFENLPPGPAGMASDMQHYQQAQAAAAAAIRQHRAFSLNGSFESVDHHSSPMGNLSRRSTGDGSCTSSMIPPLQPTASNQPRVGPLLVPGAQLSVGGSLLDTGAVTPRRLSGASNTSASDRPRRITFLGDDILAAGSSSFSGTDPTPIPTGSGNSAHAATSHTAALLFPESAGLIGGAPHVYSSHPSAMTSTSITAFLFGADATSREAADDDDTDLDDEEVGGPAAAAMMVHGSSGSDRGRAISIVQTASGITEVFEFPIDSALVPTALVGAAAVAMSSLPGGELPHAAQTSSSSAASWRICGGTPRDTTNFGGGGDIGARPSPPPPFQSSTSPSSYHHNTITIQIDSMHRSPKKESLPSPRKKELSPRSISGHAFQSQQPQPQHVQHEHRGSVGSQGGAERKNYVVSSITIPNLNGGGCGSVPLTVLTSQQSNNEALDTPHRNQLAQRRLSANGSTGGRTPLASPNLEGLLLLTPTGTLPQH